MWPYCNSHTDVEARLQTSNAQAASNPLQPSHARAVGHCCLTCSCCATTAISWHTVRCTVYKRCYSRRSRLASCCRYSRWYARSVTSLPGGPGGSSAPRARGARPIAASLSNEWMRSMVQDRCRLAGRHRRTNAYAIAHICWSPCHATST